MSVRSETLAEVIDWLGDEADREWERAKDGLSDGYGGFDAQPLLEDTKFVMCLALVGGFGLLLTLNPGLLVLPKDTTFTEQVARQAGLEALSCPTILDSKYMPGQGRYECEYVDAKGKAHDMSLLVASGDKVWLYDHNGKPMKVEKK